MATATVSVTDQLVDSCRPLVKHWYTDLDHDREWITNHQGVPFVHWTNDCGTHILPMYPPTSEYWPVSGQRIPYLFSTATREDILAGYPLFAVACSQTHRELVHWFDGRSLKTITPEEAVEIAKQYVRDVRFAWRGR
jgi:hypothetical protein